MSKQDKLAEIRRTSAELRAEAKRATTMSDPNGASQVPDLGAIRQRQRAKEQVPPYTVGNPEFALQVGVQPANGQISFRDALDRAAIILGADGWSITEVKQCVFAGGDQAGNTIFQVIVIAEEGNA
jgi:hypothetical protein